MLGRFLGCSLVMHLPCGCSHTQLEFYYSGIYLLNHYVNPIRVSRTRGSGCDITSIAIHRGSLPPELIAAPRYHPIP